MKNVTFLQSSQCNVVLQFALQTVGMVRMRNRKP